MQVKRAAVKSPFRPSSGSRATFPGALANPMTRLSLEWGWVTMGRGVTHV
jgi:hypothetical protein